MRSLMVAGPGGVQIDRTAVVREVRIGDQGVGVPDVGGIDAERSFGGVGLPFGRRSCRPGRRCWDWSGRCVRMRSLLPWGVNWPCADDRDNRAG